ncbi:S1 family peptidase [Streptomyces acidicola]|uniref:S1 family peptidase n=1 Tax=Streptomyces acidicola TaxID=2596892 RepID=UPI0037F4FCAC
MAYPTPSQRRDALRPGRFSQFGQQLRSTSAPIVLVVASVVAAVAAIVGLTVWVAVAAAVTAAVSGSQVLRTELVVPLRMRRAENATAMVFEGDGEDTFWRGAAFQIAPGRWITANHIVRDSTHLTLKIDGAFAGCQILHSDMTSNLAVLAADTDWAWHAATARSAPDVGDKLKVIGWRDDHGRGVRLTYDYLVSGRAEGDVVVIAGPKPFPGFGGGPAINTKTGQVTGVLTGHFPEDGEEAGLISPLSALPTEYL